MPRKVRIDECDGGPVTERSWALQMMIDGIKCITAYAKLVTYVGQ